MKPQPSQIVVFLLATALLTGCVDERAESPMAPDQQTSIVPSSAASPAARASAQIQELAQALALAMGSPEVRTGVRDAMRSSRVTEHKLVLQEYIRTQSGRALVEASARAMATTSGEIRKRIIQLPQMDFYVPFRDHRLTWKGTSDVAVGATMNVDDPTFTAYRTDGQPVLFDARLGTPELAVVLLHPAEAKGPRINPQPDVPGDVIQEPNDGEVSGRFITTDAAGNRRVVEFGEIFARRPDGGISIQDHDDCDPLTAVEPCHQGGGVSPPDDTTRMGSWGVSFTDGAGSSEVEWRSTYSGDDSDNTLRIECVGCTSGPEPSGPWYMIFRRVSDGSGQTIFTEVWETDAFDDDFYGNAIFNYTDNGDRQATMDSCDHVHDPEVCDGLGIDPWELVESSHFTPHWTPKP